MAQGEFFSMGTALLRYLYLFYQTAHWQSSGQSFYSAHQMFERLYSEALVDLDEWAERSIGVFNKEMVDFGKQMDLLTKLTLKYPVDQGYYAAFLQNGIKVEGEFQRYLKILKSGLERDSVMTFGLDDLIMSHSAKSENRVYLLKQSIETI